MIPAMVRHLFVSGVQKIATVFDARGFSVGSISVWLPSVELLI